MNGRLLVFGGGGFVGGNLCTLALRDGWEVHVADSTVRDALPGAAWHRIDITDGAAVAALIGGVKPTAVVDLAAVADIDRAERERELARAVNVDAARSIAAAARAAGASFVYFSSDAVFAGTAERYVEEDATGPVNWYGRTKADGERLVREAHPGAAIVRISLVLGFPVTDGNSFIAALAKKLAAGTVVPCPVDEIRTPIDVLTLSAAVLELCRTRFEGILHLGSTDNVDRFTLTQRAATLMGFDASLVTAQKPGAAGTAAATAQPARAARHRRGVISVEKARRLLSTPMLDWETSLGRAIGSRLGNGR
ncbi:MAG: sugar nucleotide-binding protein [Spirochaetes bacterium]|nr:sugar nucleotide-binding protein [Spirochaetota bacterium]